MLTQDAAYAGNTLVAADRLELAGLSNLGSTTVSGTLVADSICQNTLTINAGGSVTVRETTGGSASAVPEPRTWVLIGAALLGWLVFRRRQ